MLIQSEIPCNGQLISPNPISNGYILMLFLFIRHGARSPSYDCTKKEYTSEWNCGNVFNTGFWRTPVVNGEKTTIYKNDRNIYKSESDTSSKKWTTFFTNNDKITINFPPSCPSGNLIDSGVEHLISLGKLYRHYLIDEIHLLPRKYDPKNVFVRSSFVHRCVESSVAFMNGMYPPENDSEELHITTGHSKVEPLCPYSESTEKFDELSKEFVKTDEFKKRKEFFQNLNALQKDLDYKVENEMDNLIIGDFLNCYRCSGNELPLSSFNETENDNKSEVTKNTEIFDKLMSNMAFWETGFLEFTGNLSYMPIFEMMVNYIDHLFAMDEKAHKFYLFSAHDVTISAVLVALGYLDYDSPPPFGAHLAAELWQLDKPYLRFVYNGKVVPFRGKELMIPLDEFKSAFSL